MNHPNRFAVLAALLVSLASVASAQSAQPRVVATNTWTAALATAAGARQVVTLAPADLRHPAEYELKPSDIAVLQDADLIVYTGFETMAKRLADTAGSRKIKMVQIDADYSMKTLQASIQAIAAVLGTSDQAAASLKALQDYLDGWRAELRASGVYGAPVLVHVFQQPLMEELGFTIKGVFGPAPLEATDITKLSAQKVDYIIDNWHNEVAAPLLETVRGARFASLINFPGPDGTTTLLDVLKDDHDRLKAAH